MAEITREARNRMATAMEMAVKVLREDDTAEWADHLREANDAYMRIIAEEALKVSTATDVRGFAETAVDILHRTVDETITERRNGLRAVTKTKTKTKRKR